MPSEKLGGCTPPPPPPPPLSGWVGKSLHTNIAQPNRIELWFLYCVTSHRTAFFKVLLDVKELSKVPRGCWKEILPYKKWIGDCVAALTSPCCSVGPSCLHEHGAPFLWFFRCIGLSSLHCSIGCLSSYLIVVFCFYFLPKKQWKQSIMLITQFLYLPNTFCGENVMHQLQNYFIK